jgi:hypothetical protein
MKERFITRQRTRHSVEFKAKVAMAAPSESKTLAELAELHRQIGNLKVENDFLSNLPDLNLTGSKNRR